MSVSQLIDFIERKSRKMISGQNELSNENKKMNDKMTDIQIKFDKLASVNEMLQRKIVVTEKTTGTLQENLINSNNSKVTELERSAHNLKHYSRKNCAEIAGIPRDISHVTL